jgi:hypothetical protein
MRRRTLLAAAVAVAWPALPAATALAVPPANDNYLASLAINEPGGSLPAQFTAAVDTTEATTQPDLFDPNREGLPFGGGQPEPTSCPGGPAYGKTVWYDFSPPVPGGVEIVATGFDAAVAVYQWDPDTSRITRTLACQSAGPAPTETVRIPRSLQAGGNYTIQIGGVADAGGPLDLQFNYFRDNDGDGTFNEEPDKCLDLPGIPAFGGCPPVVRGGPRILFDRVGGGVRVTSLSVDRLDRGSRVEARCRRCGASLRRRVRRAGTLDVGGFTGRLVAAGDRITVRISHPRSGRGRYRFGAIERTVTWPVVGDRLGSRRERCSEPGSGDRIRCP